MTKDSLLERLGQLPRPALDDVASARALARAESAYAAGAPRRRDRGRWLVPAALVLWGGLYLVGATRELRRRYPAMDQVSSPGVSQASSLSGPVASRKLPPPSPWQAPLHRRPYAVGLDAGPPRHAADDAAEYAVSFDGVSHWLSAVARF